ncbi:ABC transporter permease [Caulobacter sp. Root487D2Y]|uniref:ABC transporter permease n=1 Tax=Caulobacter sp. Root487D2Y TaxID=1736547 RepID=UPI0006F829AA|nr:ABC transporter permease [Caulobacter sp. Root487D2Y]KQY28080.1 ABC transporter permease [Caulobacter sp. Root487D2Y]
MMAMLRVLAGIAFAHLWVRARATFVATLGVAIGVGFFLAVSGMMVGSQKDFIRTLIDTAPHIIVRDERRAPTRQPALTAFAGDAVRIEGLRPQEEVRGLKDWPAMLADVRAQPGAQVAPSLSGAVTIGYAGRTAAVALNGVDPRLEGRLTKIDETLIGGRLSDLEARPDGLIISRPMADRLGARLGDTLVVTASTGALQRMRILALIEPEGRAGFYAGDAVAYGLLRTAQVLFTRPNVVNQLHVRLADPDDARLLAGTLEARWGYKWESWQERSADILNLLVVRNVIMYAVILAILIVASFGIYTAVSNSVADKRRDIAILRAMGFSAFDVQAIFLIEGVAIAILGAVMGFAIGTGLLEILARLPLSIGGKPLVLPLDRGLGQYLIAGGASMTAALLAAWLPARKVARVDPVSVLRGAA